MLNGFEGQFNENFCFIPTDAVDPLRCDKNLFSRPPVFCIDNHVTNRPGLVVDDEILDMANFAIPAFYNPGKGSEILD